MNKIIKNLIFVSVFALFLGLTGTASAAYNCDPYYSPGAICFDVNQYAGYGDPAPRVSYDGGMYYSNRNDININTIPQNYVFGNTTQYNNNGYNNNSVNNTNTSNGVNDNVNYVPSNKVATNTTTNTTTNNTTNNTTTKKVATTTTKANSDDVTTTNVTNSDSDTGRYTNTGNNGLTALSLQGSNSFMPDTVWEWLCVFFLILIIVILIRQFRPKHATKVQNVAHH